MFCRPLISCFVDASARNLGEKNKHISVFSDHTAAWIVFMIKELCLILNEQKLFSVIPSHLKATH